MVHKAVQDFLVQQVLLVELDLLDLLVPREFQAHLDQQAPEGSMAILVFQGLQVQRDPLVQLVLRGQGDQQDLLVHWD